MARALRLAARGLYTTQPNPRVGCVIARGGEIVGDGWHRHAGEPHAEAVALDAAAARARGATAYVTLEPCAHQGRTPPCADALVAAGIARIVVASLDPNPRAGGGLRRLREAGIAVATGLMVESARELNRGFFARFEHGRPWVRVKLAMSTDGRTALANGESKWITGEAARADVQRWRARSSAILTGAGTARADDPRLSVRAEALNAVDPMVDGQGGDGRFVPPLRVVLDARLDALVPGAHLLDVSASTLIFHAPDAKCVAKCYNTVQLAEVPVDATGRLDLPAVLHELARRGVNEVQVESGPTLCGALFERGLVDELLLYVSPTLLGGTARPLLTLPALSGMAARWNLRPVEERRVGADWRWLLRPV